MGGLCSGRSDTPTSLEPPRNNTKGGNDQSVGVPKIQYGEKNKAGISLNTEDYMLNTPKESTGKLQMEDTGAAKNIKVEEYLKQSTPNESQATKDDFASAKASEEADNKRNQDVER